MDHVTVLREPSCVGRVDVGLATRPAAIVHRTAPTPIATASAKAVVAPPNTPTASPPAAPSSVHRNLPPKVSGDNANTRMARGANTLE